MIRPAALFATFLALVLWELRGANTHVTIVTDVAGIGGTVLLDDKPAEMLLLTNGVLQSLSAIPSGGEVVVDLKDFEWHRVSIRRPDKLGIGPPRTIKADAKIAQSYPVPAIAVVEPPPKPPGTTPEQGSTPAQGPTPPPGPTTTPPPAGALSLVERILLMSAVIMVVAAIVILGCVVWEMRTRLVYHTEWPEYLRRQHAHLHATERLASGGLADVFVVQNRRPRKHPESRGARTFPTAVKVLQPKFNDGAEAVRFLAEPEALTYLDQRTKGSEKICPKLYDVCLESPHPNVRLWYEMEYFLSHEPFRQVLKRSPTGMPWLQASEYLTALDRKLRLLHRLGVLHRDISPENFMVSREGPKIIYFIDFGLAIWPGRKVPEGWSELSISGIGWGKPHYSAPEQMQSLTDATTASDWYSFGCIAWELITGKPPYNGTNDIHKSPVMSLTLIQRGVPSNYAHFIVGLLSIQPSERNEALRKHVTLWPS